MYCACAIAASGTLLFDNAYLSLPVQQESSIHGRGVFTTKDGDICICNNCRRGNANQMD